MQGVYGNMEKAAISCRKANKTNTEAERGVGLRRKGEGTITKFVPVWQRQYIKPTAKCTKASGSDIYTYLNPMLLRC